MPIEIRELVIKVKVEDSSESSITEIDLSEIKQLVQTECKKEIKKQLAKTTHR